MVPIDQLTMMFDWGVVVLSQSSNFETNDTKDDTLLFHTMESFIIKGGKNSATISACHRREAVAHEAP